MGSGGMIVMDESSCMVDVARYFMDFCMTESCGKCTPCRVGTYQMHRILTSITGMTATPKDLAMLEGLCDLLKHTSLCGLGQSAPNPVVSTLKSLPRNIKLISKTTSARLEFAVNRWENDHDSVEWSKNTQDRRPATSGASR